MKSVKVKNTENYEHLPNILNNNCSINSNQIIENTGNIKSNYCANGIRNEFTLSYKLKSGIKDPCEISGVNGSVDMLRQASDPKSLMEKCRQNGFQDSFELNGVKEEGKWLQPTSDSESFIEMCHKNGFNESSELNGVMGKDGWLRPASESESFMEMCHQNRFMLTAYQLALTSREPIQEGDVKRALTQLYRQVPSLHMTLRQKDEALWWHYMEEEIIDFKVVDESSASQEFESLKTYRYDVRRGPLWCARLTQPSLQDHSSNEHSYHLLLGFHHAISDGPSSVRICRFFVDILNDIIQGHSFDANEQLAEFVSDDQTKKLVELEMNKSVNSKNIKNSSPISEKIETYIKSKRNVPLLISAFPISELVKPQTLTITRILDCVITSKLKSKCKSEGVTIHTGFVSIANAAIVQLLQESGLSQSSYDINSYHTVNMRRYWDGDSSKSFGNHQGVLNITTKTPMDVQDNIWDYAKSLNKEFHHLLDERAPLQELILRRLCFMKLGINPTKLLQSNDDGPKPHSYYGTTNLGDLDHVLDTAQDYVKVTGLQRSTSIHALGNTMTHVLHTYQGRLTYALDYVNTYISKETAEKYMNIITDIITNNV